MIIQRVSAEWVNHTWPLVKGFIEEALEHAKGEYTVEHVQALVASGTWTLLVAVDDGTIHGAATMYCFNRPTDRVAFVTTTSGKFILDQDTFAQLQDISRAFGATALECAARESMARLLGRFGFEEKYRIVGVKL
jgi:hypothetical protein